MRVIYVSDLDKTLLNSRARLSEFSRRELDRMIDDGLLFTYATARSFVSASAVLEGFTPKIPSVIYNGTFLRNNDTGEQILLDSFDKSESDFILETLEKRGIYPLTYAYINGKECYSYDFSLLSEGEREFVIEHRTDVRDNPSCKRELGRGEVFHFVCIGDYDYLLPSYNELKDKHQCVLYKEPYSGRFWLEIHPMGATKANAIKKLKALLNADRVVCFGDGENDISMLEVADELYAPENALEELKSRANGIVESNDDDGVVRWLIKNAIFERKN